MSFFQNTCKPKGIGGKIMVHMMNTGHSSMAEWDLHIWKFKAIMYVWILDVAVGQMSESY